MTDCLFIGHNDGDFPDYVDAIRSMGTSGALWRRLNLNFVEIGGVPMRSMDILNLVNGRDGVHRRKFSNLDFFWPALPYLVSFVKKRGFSADYVNLFQEEKASLAAKLRNDDVRTVAITTTLYVGTWWIDEIISFVRRHNRSTKIIVGGPFIYNQAARRARQDLIKLFESIGADIYVINPEGELALAHVLDALTHRRPLDTIHNIAFKRRGTYVLTNTSVESNSLAENMVDYDLFPPERFGEFASVRTARSCPFACSFCAYPIHGGKYVYEGVDTVENELDRIRRIGTVTTLTLIDDTLNVPMRRFKEILRMMIRNGYGFRWNGYIRADHLDDECIELMRDSGCEGVFLGVESGSDTVLKMMNKTSRAEHYRRVIPQLRRAGILTHCSLIVGFPSETDETLRETVDLIEETGPSTFQAHAWYCDPSTPIWKKREELQLSGTGFEWSHRTMSSETALQMVEELFVGVKNSTWLPQHGFESWSLFYLQRKGMPLDQIWAFLRAFDDAVAFKLRHPGSQAVAPALLEALGTTGRFELPAAALTT
jgi:radical SAM PhpK family P-methyltransferase